MKRKVFQIVIDDEYDRNIEVTCSKLALNTSHSVYADGVFIQFASSVTDITELKRAS